MLNKYLIISIAIGVFGLIVGNKLFMELAIGGVIASQFMGGDQWAQ